MLMLKVWITALVVVLVTNAIDDNLRKKHGTSEYNGHMVVVSILAFSLVTFLSTLIVWVWTATP